MLKVEIVKQRKFKGGVEIFARAWLHGKQLGFGKDGDVDIERFMFYRPPKNIRAQLEHTILLVGKTGTNIVPGRTGNTTSTFYPSSDDSIFASNATFATARGASTGTLRGSATQNWINCRLVAGTYFVERAFVNFDTSALPDTDAISSATLSAHGESKAGSPTSHAYNVYGSTASDTIVANDFDLVGSSAFCDTSITQAGWSTAAYNDYALNATGIAAISKTGISKFSLREVAYDVGNSAPPSADVYAIFKPVEVSGTSEDPKLVVVHAAPVTSTGFFSFF